MDFMKVIKIKLKNIQKYLIQKIPLINTILIFLRKFSFYFFIYLFSYCFFIFPYEALYYLYFGNIIGINSFLINFCITTIVISYFRSVIRLSFLRYLIHYGIGIGFIGFFILIFGLLINIIFTGNSEKIALICLNIHIFLIILSIKNGNTIYLKTLDIRTDKKIKTDINLIFLSDLHLGSNSKNHLKKIIKKIKQIKYDLLLIGGDMIDSSKFNLGNLKLFFEISKPIIFVSGNHEYYLNNFKEKLSSLKEYNINFLNNMSFKYKELNIIGISDDINLNTKENLTTKLLKRNFFNLVLVHKPCLWDFLPSSIDLMLSGHTHNGQIFPFNLIVKLKYKYIFGLYKKSNSKLYVSSGSGCWGPRMRLGSRNEIVYIKLRKK